MTRGRSFNWEAALVPFWGWLRSVPLAQGLSLPFPFLVIFLLGTERTLSWWDLGFAFAAVSAGYGLFYGFAGDWMLRRSHPVGKAQRPITVGRRITYVIGSGLLLMVGFIIVVGSLLVPHLKAYTSAMTAELRNVMELQDRHFASYGRYATTLDSLALEPSQNITVRFTRADSLSWAAEAESSGGKFRCRIFVDAVLTAQDDAQADL